MNYVKLSIAAVLLLIAAFIAGRLTAPKPIAETKIEVKKDVEVVKNTKRTTTQTKQPDGTTTTVTVVDTSSDTKSKEVDKTASKADTLPQYKIGVMLGFDKDQNKTKGLMLSHQFIGNLDLGIYGLDNHNYGFLLQLGF